MKIQFILVSVWVLSVLAVQPRWVHAAEPLRTPAQVETGLAGLWHNNAPGLAWESSLMAGTENMFLGLTVPLYLTFDDRGFLKNYWNHASDFAHVLRVLSYRGEGEKLHFSFFLGETAQLGEDAVARRLLVQLWEENPVSTLVFSIQRDPVRLTTRLVDIVTPRLFHLGVDLRPNGSWQGGAGFWMDTRFPLRMHDDLGDPVVNRDRGMLEPAETDLFTAQEVNVRWNKGSWGVSAALLNLDLKGSGTGLLLGLHRGSPSGGLTAALEGGAGGHAFVPWIMGPFYWMRSMDATNLTGQGDRTLARFLAERDSPGWGVRGELGWRFGEPGSIRMGMVYSCLETTAELSLDLFLRKRFVLVASGAWNVENRALALSVEARYSLDRRWFVWSRLRSAWLLEPDELMPSRNDLLLLGVGIRERLE